MPHIYFTPHGFACQTNARKPLHSFRFIGHSPGDRGANTLDFGQNWRKRNKIRYLCEKTDETLKKDCVSASFALEYQVQGTIRIPE